MKVTIKAKKGECFEIDTNSNDLIEAIKSKISTLKSIPNDQQRLIYDCTTLKDGEKINNYSIKNGSEIFLVEKQDTLLLQTSKIFLGSSLIDRIHQSYIDLQGKPPVQNVTSLLIEGISYLDEKLDFDTTKELFLLISSCFSQYPEEFFKVFQVKYQKPNISSLHIILLTTILSQIPNSNYDGLMSNCINEIIPQLPKNQGNFNVQGFEITPEFQTIFISNLILSIKLTEQIVTSFYQFFFSKGDFTNLNLFIQKVQKENLLTKIPESAFVENSIFLQLSFDNLAHFISIITEDAFNQILPILTNFLEQKEVPPNLSSAIINKGIEFNVRPKLIDFLFKYYNGFKSVSFWEYLSKNKTFLKDCLVMKVVDKIKKGSDYFAKTPLVLRSVEHAELLPQEVITYSLLNADSLSIYDFAFKSSKRIECNTLGTLEFWEHLLSVISKSSSYFFSNEALKNYAFYFQKYIKENDVFNIFNQLIFNHFPPNKNASCFLHDLLEKLPESYRTRFHIHDDELVDKLLQRKEFPSPSCFKLFYAHDKKLTQKLLQRKESPSHQLLYNLAFSKLKTLDISKIEIMKMTHEPHEILTMFIEQNNYDLIASIDDEPTLSLIACSVFYSSQSLLISQVSGLTCEIFLPFLAIAMNYKHVSSFSVPTLNVDHNFESLLIDSCNYLNRNPSPLQIASINSILPKISMMLNPSATQSSIICRFLDMIFDFIIKGEYKADTLPFLKAVFIMSQKKSLKCEKPILFTKKELINLIIENIPKFIHDNTTWGVQCLDTSAFDSFTLLQTFTKLIEESTSYEPIIQTIKFINSYCSNKKKLCFNDYSNINTALQKAIYEDKWDDVLAIIKFIRLYNIAININGLYFYGKEIPLDVIQCLNDFSKIENVNTIITALLQTKHLEKNIQLFTSLYHMLMKNTSLSVKQLTVCLEKILSQQLISPQDIIDKLYYFKQKYYADLINTIKHSYIFSSSKQKFIKRINCKPIQITSMNFDFLATLIQTDSYQSFICLQNIASFFPFLFEPDFTGADENNSLVAVNIVLPALNHISQVFDIENAEKNMNNLKKAFAALNFLYSCLYSVKFLSIFVVWIFENIVKLNESQVFGLSHILISLFKTDAINKIILAYAVKYNFLDTIANLLNRKIPEGLFKHYYNQNLYDLSAQYYRSFSNIRYKGDALFIEHIQAQKILTPFENHFNNSISICPTKLTSLTFTFPHLTKPLDDLFTFIEDIKKTKYFWICADFAPNTSSAFGNSCNHDFIKKFSDDVPKLIETKIANIPIKITTEMHGYLLTCPKWALNYFENNSSYFSSSSSLKLLQQIPEYNDYIVSTIQKLNMVKKSNESYSNSINSYDYFKTKMVSQPFYHAIIKEASSCIEINPTGVLSNLLSYANQTSLEYIKYLIQYISDYISKPQQINSQELKILLQILNRNWNNKREIENEFLEKCGNKIIDIVLSNSFRSNEFIINSMTSILSSLNGQLPKQAGQFVGLIFGYYPKLTNKAVDLYFRISDSESFNIIPIIKMRYKKDTDEENPDFSRIKYYLKKNPSLIVDCILTTKNLLSKVIAKYQEEDYQNSQLQEMIVEIFNGVAPNPSLRNSIDRKPIIQKDKNDDLLYQVPDYIKQTDPIFWGDFYEKNRPFLNEMLKKNDRNIDNLIFLSDYNELVSFHLRYLILKKNLNKIRGSGYVQINVSRSRLLLDSFGYWCISNPKDFISGLNVYFVGEDGSDSGGLTREWLTYIVKELMKPETGLFVKSENQTYHLNSETNLNFLNNEVLKMAGAIFAISIIKDTNVSAHLSTALLRQILHQEIKIDDMKDYDESLFNSFQSILNSSDVKPLDLVFSIDELKDGDLKQVNLVENGDKVEVTNENKTEYVNLYANYKLKKSVSEQIEAFCEGFESIIDPNYIKMFTPEELDVIICGNETIDIEDMKKNVEYEGGYNENHPVIKMFFNVISKWSQENLSKLLLFITGSSKVGVCGFEEFRNNGNSLKISSRRNKDYLPVAHTCSKELVLPEYDNEKDMNDKLLLAIQDCHFGLS